MHVHTTVMCTDSAFAKPEMFENVVVLGARERQSLEVTGQLEHTHATVSYQKADIAALTNETDDLNARLSQGREHSTSSRLALEQVLTKIL